MIDIIDIDQIDDNQFVILRLIVSTNYHIGIALGWLLEIDRSISHFKQVVTTRKKLNLGGSE